MSYAIISVGGKQYRVQEGERLLVDRVAADEGATLTLDTLLVGGNGDAELRPKGITVTAKVVRHVLGKKIRIGKYKPKSGYRRHTGYRSKLSQLEIEAIGKPKPARAAKPKAEAAVAGEEKPKAAPKPKPRAAAKPAAAEAKPKPAAKPKTSGAAAKKPAARRPKKEEG
jgi:large subunit ribosomal protein L21